MMNKTCACCKLELPVENFSSSSTRKSGLHCYCKPCENEKSRAQYAKHKARKDAQNKRWYEENKQIRLLSQYAWQEKNKNKVSEIQKSYRKRNLSKDCAKVMRREASKINATPEWANNTRIQCYYSLAAMFNKNTEQKWHVDHIVPLRGKNVCGLHVDYNLRVIPAIENMKKGNRYV